MLPAGKLNRRIAIQARVQKQDAGGQPLDDWVEAAKVWSWPKTQTGMGVTRNTGNVHGVVSAYSFRIRYRPGITDDMRVIHDGMVFAIQQVQHDVAGREWTDIVCRVGAIND